MHKTPLSIDDFLLARVQEAEREALNCSRSEWIKLRPIFDSQRMLINWHKNWPVLVETQPKLEVVASDTAESITYKMSQNIMFLTHEEYRSKFGQEPPTAPLLREMAMLYVTHPDWREEWRA